MAAAISFRDDYSEIGHPRVIEALARAGSEQNGTYGLDKYSAQAADMIRREIGCEDAYVHLIGGGTQANIVNLSSILRPYEAVIACDTGHIAVHEAGAIEASGHRIVSMPHRDGKLTVAAIEAAVAGHRDEHMVKPRAVYISQTTESGSLYSKAELTAIAELCRAKGLYLYIDGARLGCALTAPSADMTLPELAALADLFYIGGTKNGALLGEAVVIMNPALRDNYRHMLKQRGALLAKGAVLGVQFCELFKDGLYWDLARHANDMAARLAGHIAQAGFGFQMPPQTNQIFPVLPDGKVAKLERDFAFYRWGAGEDGKVCIRLVTSWATRPEDVEAFGRKLKE